MKIITSPFKLQKELIGLKKQLKIVGFVPTMGYLHQGHLSLIKEARKSCDIVVVSIFVNPLQFAPKEDFKRYPRDLKKDILLCRNYADFLFVPSNKDMYGNDFSTYIEVPKLSNILCGVSRPGHFKGVVTVVAKLFNIVMPDMAFFGQKDAQQVIIIKKMVRDLNMPIKIKVMPTVREKDGLAMSSRNAYLSKEEREESNVLYKALKLAKELVRKGELKSGKVIMAVRKLILQNKHVRIDYIACVDTLTLEPVRIIKGNILIVLAVFIGQTRLIDNVIVKSVKSA